MYAVIVSLFIYLLLIIVIYFFQTRVCYQNLMTWDGEIQFCSRRSERKARSIKVRHTFVSLRQCRSNRGFKWFNTPTHTQSCVRCILRTSYCSPLLFPLLFDFFRHLPLDLYTFFNRGHLLTITANRGPIVPLCYKSSVYPLHIPTDTHTRTHGPTDLFRKCFITCCLKRSLGGGN